MSDASPLVDGDELDGNEQSPFIETPPEPAPRTRRTGGKRGRLAAALTGDTPAPEPPPPKPPKEPATTPKERAPRTRPPSGRRTSLADGIGMIYGGLGQVLERADPTFVPTARALAFNAPVAGKAFDDLIAGTALDRALQPMAKRGDKITAAANAVGFPIIIYALTTRPELWPALAPMARELFYSNLVAMAPAIKAKKDREREMAKVMKELQAEGMIAAKLDGSPITAEELFDSIFAPIDGAEPPTPPAEPPA